MLYIRMQNKQMIICENIPGTTRAAYGQAGNLVNPDPTEIHLALDIWSYKGRLKCPFYGIFRPILAPQDPLMAITEGPNGTNRPSWMYPNQI